MAWFVFPQSVVLNLPVLVWFWLTRIQNPKVWARLACAVVGAKGERGFISEPAVTYRNARRA